MSKFKLKGILTASALLVFSAVTVSGLAACSNDEPTEETVKVTALSITNKSALEADFHLSDQDRMIELSVTTEDGEGVPQDLINDGTIKIVSSDTNVVTVIGSYIKAMGEGTATITVSAGEIVDTVTITVVPTDTTNAMTIGKILSESKEADKVEFYGQVIFISRGGFFLGDDTGLIYVYANKPSDMAVGETYYVKGTVDIYGGVKQITSGFTYERADQQHKLNVELDYTEVTGEQLNNVHAEEADRTELTKRILKGAVPAKMTLMFLEHSDEDKDGFIWKVLGADDVTVVYTGYIESSIYEKWDLHVGSTFEMEGLINGVGSHNSYTNRINFYPNPNSITQVADVKAESVQITARKSTLKIGETTSVSYKLTPAGVAGEVVLEVTEGKDVLSVDGMILKAAKAGTAKVVATENKSGIKSAPITITVENEELKPGKLADVFNQAIGERAYFYAIVTENVSGYGVAVEDGDKALLAYGATLPEGVNVGDYCIVDGKLDEYNGKQLSDEPSATITKVEESAIPEGFVPSPAQAITINENNANALSDINNAFRTVKGVELVATSDAKIDGNVCEFNVEVGEETYLLRADKRRMESEPFSILSQVKKGAKVSFDARLTFFNGTPQFGYFKNVSAKTADGKPIEPSTVAYEQLAPKTITFDDLKTLTVEGAKPNPSTLKGEQLYSITGIITDIANTTFGNVYISADGANENEFYLYGLTATETAMTYDKSTGTYTYDNPKDYSTNEMTKSLKVKDEITITFKLDEHNGEIQGNAILTDVKPAPLPAIPETPNEEGVYTFDYTFEGSPFSTTGGEAVLNDRVWNYDASSRFGTGSNGYQGVQIGTTNAPQTEPWHLTTELPEGATITSYEVVLNAGATAQEKAATYTISFGDHEKTGTFIRGKDKVDGVYPTTTVSEESLTVSAESFTLTLKTGEKALYIASISFSYTLPSA